MKALKRQLLVVEDHAEERKRICEELGLAFPDLRVVGLAADSDLRKHVERTAESEIVLVVADAVLGDIERGTDTLLFCRQRLPHVRRVLMSDKASREDLEDAINVCALDGYVEKNKPFRNAQLEFLKRLLINARTGEPLNELTATKAIDDLKHIVAGSPVQANLFKNSIRDLLAYVFYPWLLGARTEVQIRDGTKAIDILFQNAAREGMLADLKLRYSSLLVPVETKNSKDLESGYFSQLEAYLTPTIGRWGILCFRGEIAPKYLKQIRATHTVAEGKFVMLLTDAELIELARAKFGGRQSRDDYQVKLDQFLRKKFDRSIG